MKQEETGRKEKLEEKNTQNWMKLDKTGKNRKKQTERVKKKSILKKL